MIWPQQIRLLSVPTLVFFTLFLWNAAVYVVFSRLLPDPDRDRNKFLYFGLTSLCLAAYTFGSIMLYSAPGFEAAYFWQKWQLAASIPTFSFFIIFSTLQLEIRGAYWLWVVPWVSLLFLPFVFSDGFFVLPNPAPKEMTIGSYQTRIYEGKLGVLGIPYFIWLLANLFLLARYWWKNFRTRWPGKVMLVGFIVFLLTVINDILVATEVYPFFYILELGFVAFILTMSFQLFHDYLEKSRQVEALSEEMRFLMSTISHDFNSPLLSIEGFSDRLAQQLGGEGQTVHYLERIQVNSRHLRELVSDLSDYLKIGRVEESPGWVDIGSVVRQTLKMLDVASANPHPQILLPETWPRVWGSEKRLKQIFLNLCQNTLKYSPPDRTWIRVGWEEKGDGIFLVWEDRGPGISAHLCQKIFDPFFRELRQQPGSGLGLAIVKKCLENMGGKIWVDPDYREGARFCLWLPKNSEE